MSFFYEIRSTTDTVLKRTGGYPDREAATEAARADAKKMKSARKPIRPDIARIMVGQNTEKATRE